MALSPLLRKAAEESKNKYGRSDGKRIQPKEGRNVYRIICPTGAAWLPADGRFWLDLGVHWIKPSPTGKPIAVVGSRDVCYGEPCPVGTAVDLAKGAAFDEDTKKMIEEWRVSRSVLFVAIDRTTKADNQVPEILELKPTAAQQVIDLLIQYDDAGQDMCDINTGLDLVVNRNGKGFDTKYTVNVKPGVSAPVAPAAIGQAPDLKAHIAQEFFRGEENKALAAIGQLSGITIPRLQALPGGAAVAGIAGPSNDSLQAAAAARTPTPALTSTATQVPDAELEAAVAAAEAAPVQNVAAAQVAQVAQAAPAHQAAVAAPVVAAAPAEQSLTDADVEDVLAQLDKL